MRTENKTINIYKFDELDKETQNKVITRFIEGNDYSFLTDDLTEICKDELSQNDIKINKLEIGYSLSYCQGDGFNFIGSFNWQNYLIHIKKSTHHYEHKRTTDILIMDENGEDIFNSLESEKAQNIFNEFQEIYFKICDNCEKHGYAIIEDIQSEEYIKENIEANEYEFLSNGDIY